MQKMSHSLVVQRDRCKKKKKIDRQQFGDFVDGLGELYSPDRMVSSKLCKCSVIYQKKIIKSLSWGKGSYLSLSNFFSVNSLLTDKWAFK